MLALVFVGVVFAYPILASTMSIAGAGDSSTPSVILRITVALLALWSVYLSRHSLRLPGAAFGIAFVLFWTAYLIRILVDGYVYQVSMNIPASMLFAYSIIFSLIPALAGFSGLNLKSSATTFNALAITGIIAMLLLAVDSREVMVEMQQTGVTRFTLEKLNPSSVGAVGGTLVLLGIAGLFADMGIALLRRIVFMGMILVGVIALVLAASRGPILATGMALILFFAFPLSAVRIVVLSGVVALMGYVAVSTYQVGVDQFSIDVVERILVASEEGNARTDLWRNAWQQFMENPIFGDAIAERSTGFYPHNTTLEAFMATGVIGGLAHLYILVAAIIASMRLLSRRLGYEWLPLLCIQYMVGSQFTGAHWTNGAHWLTMVAVIVTEFKSRPTPRR